MGDTNESKRTSSSGMENLALQNKIPRDFLQRFMGGGSSLRRPSELIKQEDDDDSGAIELNLGLSLGGRFGVDKSSNKLIRSSSIAGPFPLVREEEIEVLTQPAVSPCPRLVRTSSLPVETEEEWRKRKEMQSLRRLEAKRRRSEKQRVSKGDTNKDGEIEVNLRGRGQYIAAMNKVGSSASPKGNYVIGGGRQGSMDSQGGCSSSMSELESKQLQGSSSCGDGSPASIQAVQDRSYRDTVGPTGSSGTKSGENTGRPPSGAEMENPSKKMDAVGNRAKETGMNSLEDMPCVFTKGDGPNGRRIEGILYKYGKGEEVRIMCVCHGTFHTPAGFVKHAGGTDITNPLKHIVVNPNSSFS